MFTEIKMIDTLRIGDLITDGKGAKVRIIGVNGSGYHVQTPITKDIFHISWSHSLCYHRVDLKN